MNTRVGKINEILAKTGGTRYLEIGVRGGETFLQVNARLKVAVDPAFAFDYAAHEAEGVFFYPVTSDAFFEVFDKTPAAAMAADADGVPRFDVIFIDGLHTFDQSYRDFIHSLRYAHDKTVWVIDDTVPNDPYSALPDFDKCMKYRTLAGLYCALWHGDVFKTIVAIHDRHKEFFFRTVIDAGNPQTVLWKVQDGVSCRENICRNLAEIASMDYFDIAEKAHSLMLGSSAHLADALFTRDTSALSKEDATALFFYGSSSVVIELEKLLHENIKLSQRVEALRKEVERLS